jgi:membrane protein DedA with SNARE-associated domain
VRHLVDLIGRAAQPWGYVVVFLTVTLEASASVGLIFPGETALLVGGFLASQHKLNLWMLMVLGVAGAVIGDSIGYEVGRHLGGRLQQSRLGRKVGDERWERARDTLRRYGGRAVLIGRWVGVLRALVPAAAGDSGLPYGTFLVWNVAGRSCGRRPSSPWGTSPATRGSRLTGPWAGDRS